MNLIEMYPCGEHGVAVVLTTPEGDVSCQFLSWKEFDRLRSLDFSSAQNSTPSDP
jgi:hypothetical protein